MYPPDQSKYRSFWGNWKPRRKPHFFRCGDGWQVIQTVPGSNIGKCAIGRTPQEALHMVENFK